MEKKNALDLTGSVEAVRQARVRPARAIPDKKRKQALMLFKKGFGYRTVASLLDLSENTVRGWSRQYKKGEFEPNLRRELYCYSEEAKRTVIALRLSGWSWKRIADETGVHSTTARLWVQQALGESGNE